MMGEHEKVNELHGEYVVNTAADVFEFINDHDIPAEKIDLYYDEGTGEIKLEWDFRPLSYALDYNLKPQFETGKTQFSMDVIDLPDEPVILFPSQLPLDDPAYREDPEL